MDIFIFWSLVVIRKFRKLRNINVRLIRFLIRRIRYLLLLIKKLMYIELLGELRLLKDKTVTLILLLVFIHYRRID